MATASCDDWAEAMDIDETDIEKSINGMDSWQVEAPEVEYGRLQKMPSELILRIEKYLPAPSVVALSHTCRLYRSSPVVIEDSLDRSRIRSRAQQSRSRFEARLRCDQRSWHSEHYFHMNLYIDRRPKNGIKLQSRNQRLRCVACGSDRHLDCFSLAATRGPAKERQCLACEGRLWCPDKIWNLNIVDYICDTMSRT